jgi:hypothetical protein
LLPQERTSQPLRGNHSSLSHLAPRLCLFSIIFWGASIRLPRKSKTWFAWVIYKGILTGLHNSKKPNAILSHNSSRRCSLKEFAHVIMAMSTTKIFNFQIQMQMLFPFKIRTPKEIWSKGERNRHNRIYTKMWYSLMIASTGSFNWLLWNTSLNFRRKSRQLNKIRCQNIRKNSSTKSYNIRFNKFL